MSSSPIPTALTIAGSDSGGGAGIQADLKAFEAHGVFGMSVVTAVTAQNSHSVTAIHDIPVAVVAAQIDAVAEDFPVGAVKTGMLASPEIVAAVAEGIEQHSLGPVVVDPVMVSKSGDALLAPEAVGAVAERLIPLATLVTPNAHEAARLAGFDVRTLDDARRAADAILRLGPGAVLIKGGHLDGESEAVDVLMWADGESVFREARVDTPHTHGTGCTYASAIAANLARGLGLAEAVQRARSYLQQAILHAVPLGSGHGPTRHFWFLDGSEAGQGNG
ncbi:MAG: bifunctional hydroxymethylpyrimidine kinase/phosphomethylpyrimidine kinase [Rhodothermaceae bacterium]|nr:bifunctional hydroxymethylpyrimidine kinase/phosphomethylpyrimidine kinase [Rhodothermaceae bacterium]MBC12592.1 bifunctional hydroxymethylpyrimidine kinase/phosphomethylpyrimidine kinase [Rhodothermaceae bacterium]